MSLRTLVLAVVVLSAVCCSRPPTQTSGNPEIPVSGPAVWKIDGVEYKIEGTALLVMGNGQGLFIVKALCDFAPNADHRPIAESIARYVVANGLQKKAVLDWNGKPLPFSGSIGIALMQQRSALNVTTTNGYKFVFSVEDLEKKMANQSPEPMVMSVTPRACARVAPATTMAHL